MCTVVCCKRIDDPHVYLIIKWWNVLIKSYRGFLMFPALLSNFSISLEKTTLGKQSSCEFLTLLIHSSNCSVKVFNFPVIVMIFLFAPCGHKFKTFNYSIKIIEKCYFLSTNFIIKKFKSRIFNIKETYFMSQREILQVLSLWRAITLLYEAVNT